MDQSKARSVMGAYINLTPEEQQEFRGMLTGYQMAQEAQATKPAARQPKNKPEQAAAAEAGS